MYDFQIQLVNRECTENTVYVYKYKRKYIKMWTRLGLGHAFELRINRYCTAHTVFWPKQLLTSVTIRSVVVCILLAMVVLSVFACMSKETAIACVRNENTLWTLLCRIPFKLAAASSFSSSYFAFSWQFRYCCCVNFCVFFSLRFFVSMLLLYSWAVFSGICVVGVAENCLNSARECVCE